MAPILDITLNLTDWTLFYRWDLYHKWFGASSGLVLISRISINDELFFTRTFIVFGCCCWWCCPLPHWGRYQLFTMLFWHFLLKFYNFLVLVTSHSAACVCCTFLNWRDCLVLLPCYLLLFFLDFSLHVLGTANKRQRHCLHPLLLLLLLLLLPLQQRASHIPYRDSKLTRLLKNWWVNTTPQELTSTTPPSLLPSRLLPLTHCVWINAINEAHSRLERSPLASIRSRYTSWEPLVFFVAFLLLCLVFTLKKNKQNKQTKPGW